MRQKSFFRHVIKSHLKSYELHFYRTLQGIFDFLKTAEDLPHIPSTVADSYDDFPDLPPKASPNVQWLGFLRGDVLRQAYLDSQIIVVPSH